ncbi:YihY/virulence factor BrkB family protein [Phycisphaerales bacterium AB-hyl4]|uniref:YihY/virulence factor BrkB family protein n=1 Tax=Natronomicrosphaera hydrolytica TaxID=3242702 RepID=A0ABV4U731_9BACT
MAFGEKAGSFWSATKEVFGRFTSDQPFQLAAALSFYLLLSLAPLLLVVVGVAGLVLGEQAARGELVEQIEGTVGTEGAEAVQTVLAHAEQIGGGAVSLTIGLVTLLVGATTVFAQLQNSLNQIWRVQPSPKKSNAVWTFIRTRLLALGVVVMIGILLLASLITSSVLAGMQEQVDAWLPGLGVTSRVLDLVFTLVVMTVLIALVFKFLPDVKIAWRDVWVGAAVTGVLFGIGKFAIGAYLGQAGIGSAYGAAGSLVVLLVWVYYSALILFFGAEITHVYARRVGANIQPADYAERTDRAPGEPSGERRGDDESEPRAAA